MSNKPSNKQKTDKSFADKWPPSVASRGYSQIPNCLICCNKALGISTPELVVLLQLITYDYGSKIVWPSHGRLARQCGKSSTAVRANIVSLEGKGFLKRIYRNGTSNAYDLMPLIEILKRHECEYPAKKQAPPSLKTNRPPPQKTSSKEDGSRKQINNKSSMRSAGEILNTRYNKL